MSLRASIDLGNEYYRVEHISEAKDVKAALAGFSAEKRAAGLELYLIRYYEKTLGFSKLEDSEANFIYGHIKPKYDQDCVFMCRRI